MQERDNYPLHILLFLATVGTTMLAGATLTTGHPDGNTWPGGWLSFIWQGSTFSFAFLAFLTCHEFGHYFAALIHKVKCSLPYYIPIPPFIGIIGSMGAVIRLREHPRSTTQVFDIGIAGPLAGFVISLICLTWGFTHLPPLGEYISNIHPDYATDFGGIPTVPELLNRDGQVMSVGTCLLFEGMKWIFSPDPQEFPPSFELMHYPWLFVGYLTLFFTALNLLPIGQLDGGHVMFGLFGPRRAGIIARVAVMLLLFIGGAGLVKFGDFDPNAGKFQAWLLDKSFWVLVYAAMLHFTLANVFPQMNRWKVLAMVVALVGASALLNLLWTSLQPNYVWLIYTFIAVRFVGLDHPPVDEVTPLTRGRKILGWIAIAIFVLCFTTDPLVILG